ncbi:MAG: hypothetical protein IJ812_10480, partial [Schwartzia sp.]|nr:hypothetical protein [Schwartzia sp. (in: firmicutes)]
RSRLGILFRLSYSASMNDSCSMFSSRFLVDIFLYFIIFGDLFGVSLIFGCAVCSRLLTPHPTRFARHLPLKGKA